MKPTSTRHSEKTKRATLRRRSVFLLPNAITTAALFCGFFAIVSAMNKQFYQAAISIFVAMVLDALDGRVARMTNTQSDFGAQYDSLSDMVSFGVAPAFVIYEWALLDMGKLGWVAAFVYCTCAALRLARFNTNLKVIDIRYFQGLPSPAAAALVVGFILLIHDMQLSPHDFAWVAWAITLFAGLTMVSNVPFYSFKDNNLRKPVPYAAIVLIAVALICVALAPAKMIFAIVATFSLSGYVIFITRLAKGKPVSLVEVPYDGETEEDINAIDEEKNL